MHAVHIKIHVDAQHIAERKRKHRPENDSTSLLTVSAKARLSTLRLHITPDTLMLLPTVGHICRDTDPLTQGACGHIYVVPTLEEKGDGEGGRDGEGDGGGDEGGRGGREEGGEDSVDGREERTEWMEGRRGQSGWKGGEDRVDGREERTEWMEGRG